MQTTLRRHLDPRQVRAALTAGARALNIALGLWMVGSTWLWTQSHASRVSARLVGLAIAVLAAVGFWREEMRYVVTGLAIFLGFSAGGIFNLPTAPLVNQLCVAFAVFVLALLPAFRPVDEQP
jgi:hypothetical protein